MENCLFCKIIKGLIPAQKVYDDEKTLVFRDISPKAPVHLLAIHRDHFAGVHEISPDKMSIMAEIMNSVAAVIKKENLAQQGYRLVVNFGEDAGQAVPHIHVHILAGRPLGWPPG